MFLKIEEDSGLCLACNEAFAAEGKPLTEKIMAAKKAATLSDDPAEIGRQCQAIVTAAEDIKTILVFGNAKMNFMPEGSVNPYIAAGLGYFHAQGEKPESENAFGAHGFAGLQVPVSEEIEIYLEGDYIYGATEGDAIQFVIGRMGLNFTF